jgi:hypothetical protein
MTNVELDRTVNEVILVAIETIWIRLSRHVNPPLLPSSSSTAYECISRSFNSFRFILFIGNKVSPLTKQTLLAYGST